MHRRTFSDAARHYRRWRLASAPTRGGATVDLSEMDLPANMNTWPHFHNGVAAGLRVAPDAEQIDAAWILYNRPKVRG